MSDFLLVWHRIDDLFSELTMYREFKTGQRCLFGLDGVSLVLIALSLAIGLGLILFGMTGSKLAIPPILMLLVTWRLKTREPATI